VSFTFVARHHVRELRKYYRLYEIDELAFHCRDVFSKPVCLIHPYFFVVQRHPQQFFNNLHKFKAIIGIDVADTDQLGRVAVQLANMATAFITHSTFAREVYVKSGVKIPVYVVPHGLDRKFFDAPKLPTDPYLRKLLDFKQKRNAIYVLFFLWHSGERKGADLVYKVLSEIQKTWSNVYLVCKCGSLAGHDVRLLQSLRGFVFSRWLDDHNLVALYDMCEIYTLLSRGGGFELNGLEALARGLVVLAGSKGSWVDYLPDFCLIKKVHRVRFWSDTDPINSIHCGCGYEVDINEAVDKLHDVLNNLDDYRARVREYFEKVKLNFTWESVGMKLKEVVDKYL